MRYVVGDLEEVGAELGRRAREVSDWLDAVAAGAGGVAAGAGGSTADAVAVSGLGPDVVARGDLACYQALSAAERRLRAASRAVLTCLEELRMADADIGRRIAKGAG